MPEKLPIILVLDNIRSLHNVGSIFRSSDGAAIERVILCGLTPTPPRPEIEKTALGTIATVPWHYHQRLTSAVAEYAERGYVPIALEQTAESTDLYSTSLPERVLLIAGHERSGVSREALRLCRCAVHLPMGGRGAHSLNVATCCGIALYELRRRACYT